MQSEAQKSGGGGGQLDPDNGDDDGEETEYRNTTQKGRDLIKGKDLVGKKPGNIHQPNPNKPIKVDTELPGELKDAEELFEKLTSRKPEYVDGRDFQKLPDGGRIEIRNTGKSTGGPKIEITDMIQNILEKITFKK